MRGLNWYDIGLPRKRWAAPWRRLLFKVTRRWHWGALRWMQECPTEKRLGGITIVPLDLVVGAQQKIEDLKRRRKSLALSLLEAPSAGHQAVIDWALREIDDITALLEELVKEVER